MARQCARASCSVQQYSAGEFRGSMAHSRGLRARCHYDSDVTTHSFNHFLLSKAPRLPARLSNVTGSQNFSFHCFVNLVLCSAIGKVGTRFNFWTR